MHRVLKPVTPEESRRAKERLEGHVLHSPMVKLKWRRPEKSGGQGGPEIYLKLENLQPINSFKIRGAVNAILKKREDERIWDLSKCTVVTCSAGNMGQAVSYASKVLGCLGAVVIVPDNAPKNKIDKMVNESYGLSSGSSTKVIKVPYDRWWRVLESGDPKEELARAINEEKLHQKSLGNVIFIHPVCDQGVLEGNSTLGLEIGEWIEGHKLVGGKTGVFVAYGGGGCSIGISCGLRNIENASQSIDVIAVEPETAAPFATSISKGEITPINFKPSFCDGCGGKAVLPNMWKLARQTDALHSFSRSKPLISTGVSVSLKEIEAALACLFDQQKVVAEGAGACGLAAAMFHEKAIPYERVVAVVCGGCIDREVLMEIIDKVDQSKSKLGMEFQTSDHYTIHARRS